MKQSASIFPVFIVLVVLVFNACSDKCKNDCDSCETQDPETCECIVDLDCRCNNGKLDGDEFYIDCGGSCPECACEFDPCSFLTGDDKKTWEYVNTVDANGNEIPPSECSLDWTYTFLVEHLVEFGCPQNGNYNTMLWEFDDPEFPTEMVFTDAFGYQYGYKVHTLKADTLRIIEQIGLSTYVPQGE